MISLSWLIPAALVLGALGLASFLWALSSGQFEDLDGASYRALEDETPGEAAPLPEGEADHAAVSADKGVGGGESASGTDDATSPTAPVAQANSGQATSDDRPQADQSDRAA